MVRFAEKCSRGLLNTTYVLLVWPIGFGFALTIGRLAMWCFTSSLELFGLACQNSYRANPSNLRGKASMLFHVNSRPRLGRSRRDWRWGVDATVMFNLDSSFWSRVSQYSVISSRWILRKDSGISSTVSPTCSAMDLTWGSGAWIASSHMRIWAIICKNERFG